MNHILVLLPKCGPVWWLDGKFLGGVLLCAWKGKNTGAKVPGWLKTATKYYILEKPHGKTQYKRDNRNNFLGHIGLVVDVKRKGNSKAAAEIESIVSFICSVMQKYSQDKCCGPNILDYLKNEESKRGLYNHFTQYQGAVKQDIKQVE